MTTFDDRERGYEAKFAHDEELRFRATARRNKFLAAWVAAKLGLSGTEVDDYVRSVIREDITHPGDHHIVAKVKRDFEAKGVACSESEIRAKLVEFTVQAVREIEASR